MKILVTGAQGQVGSELIRQCKEQRLQMCAAGRCDMDITSENAVSLYFDSHNPDLVINAAAYTAVDKAEDEPALAFAVNRDGPALLAAECAQRHIPLLHISTDYVFDGTKSGAYDEKDQPDPQGVYGKSKLEGERAVERMLEEYIILRVAWVFGATGGNFVRTMLRLGGEREELDVVADQRGGPTWAGDIASVLLSIVEHYHKGKAIQWGTYHYTGEPVTTWYDFARDIFDAAILEGMLEKTPRINAITTAEYPTPAVRPKNSELDCHKIERELGTRQPDWRFGLKSVLKDWKGKT